MNFDPTNKPSTRRQFLAKAAYSSPVILTLPAVAAFAQSGSTGVDTGGTGTNTCGTQAEIDSIIQSYYEMNPDGGPTDPELLDLLNTAFPGGPCDS